MHNCNTQYINVTKRYRISQMKNLFQKHKLINTVCTINCNHIFISMMLFIATDISNKLDCKLVIQLKPPSDIFVGFPESYHYVSGLLVG